LWTDERARRSGAILLYGSGDARIDRESNSGDVCAQGFVDVFARDVVVGGVPEVLAVFDEDELGGFVGDAEFFGERGTDGAGFDDVDEVKGRGVVFAIVEILFDPAMGAACNGAASAVFVEESRLTLGFAQCVFELFDASDFVHEWFLAAVIRRPCWAPECIYRIPQARDNRVCR